MVSTHRIIANFLNTFDLPFFFFVSGFLYAYLLIQKGKYKETGVFIINKIKRLVLPYFIWGGVMLIIYPNLCTPIAFINGIAHLWFLPTLFCIFLVFAFFHPIKTSLYTDIILVLLTSLALKWIHLNTDLPLFLRQACKYTPYFVIGFVYEKHIVKTILNEFKAWIIGIGLIITVCLVEGLIIIKFNNSYISFLIYIILISMVTILLLEFYRKCSPSIPKHIEKAVNNLDKNSMGIYILHQILIWGLLSVNCIYTYFQIHILFAPLLLFLIIFPLSWIIAEIINKSVISKILFG